MEKLKINWKKVFENLVSKFLEEISLQILKNKKKYYFQPSYPHLFTMLLTVN